MPPPDEIHPSPREEPTESTSLLSKDPASLPNGQDGAIGDGKPSTGQSKSWMKAHLRESLVILKASIPVILAYMLQNSLQTTSVLIVGRLSPEALATSAFAYMFAMSTGWLVALGGSTAIDTLASASFTGSTNPADLSMILQRAFAVLSAMYVPVVLLWAFSDRLFLALGQEEYIARDARRFLLALAPGGLGYIFFECVKKSLQAQELMRPGTYVLLLTAPLNVALNYLFVHTLALGLLGAPLATGISYWLSFLLLVAYARFAPAARCFVRLPLRTVLQPRGLLTFARLAILGVIHVGTEWWAFEIVALVAGQLGTVPLAAQSVIMTTDQVLNTIPFGVGVAASARVGNLLGGRDAKGAARAGHAAAWTSMALGAVVLAVLLGVKDNFARLFNDDEDVVVLTAKVLPYVALFQVADGLTASCGGVLRAMGRQHVGATVNIVSYYCGALPLGIWLAFHGWGLQGLWVGQCIALYLVGSAQYAIVAWSDWNVQVRKALRRIGEDDGDDQRRGEQSC